MTIRLIAGLVLVALGAAISAGLLWGMYGPASAALIRAGIPGVLLGELVAIVALCAGCAVLVHIHFKRRRSR